MTFAEKVLSFRIDNRLSQTETAKIVGVTQADISAYENGKREPNKLNRVYFERKMQEYERGKKQC